MLSKGCSPRGTIHFVDLYYACTVGTVNVSTCITHTDTDSTELNTSASELEHIEMNTNDAYATNAAEIATTENIAYMTAGDTIPATQNVAYKLVPPRSDENYDYIICD